MCVSDSMRRAVGARDQYTCRACGFCDEMTFQADHSKPRSLGGLDTLENLQTLCTWCNNAKGNTDTGILPQRSQPVGYGDPATVKANRLAFQAMLAGIRMAEFNALVAQASDWRRDGKKGPAILKKLKSLTTTGVADRVMKEIR